MKLTKEEILKATECYFDNCSCQGCPMDSVKKSEMKDRTCVQFLLGQYRELIKEPVSTIDIPKIIDEAMDKKNRSVTVFVGPQGTTVNVYPYQETKPHWISKDNGYICSECGSRAEFPWLHCPTCGEGLRLEEWITEGKNDEQETSVE